MDILIYWMGVLFAVISGIINNLGTIFQKKVVNSINQDEKFFKNLIKSPLWIIGLIFQNIIGAIFFFFAQIFIGPTLIPGLMASGLIILAIGSIRILRENLNFLEILGIFLMILAITFLGLSNMAIDPSKQNFLDAGLLIRITIFTTLAYGLSVICHLVQKRNFFKGTLLAIYSGLQFTLSNFWISILIGVFPSLLNGTGAFIEIILFIIASSILIETNIFGITSLQKAFKKGQASNLIPIQQVPIQITPPLYHLLIFLLPFPNLISLFFLVIGVILVIVSSFILGKRQAKLEKIS